MSDELGATGEFPDGKINPSDEGQIRIGMTIDKDKIIIHFGKPIVWIGLNKDDALILAQALLNKAYEL